MQRNFAFDPCPPPECHSRPIRSRVLPTFDYKLSSIAQRWPGAPGRRLLVGIAGGKTTTDGCVSEWARGLRPHCAVGSVRQSLSRCKLVNRGERIRRSPQSIRHSARGLHAFLRRIGE